MCNAHPLSHQEQNDGCSYAHRPLHILPNDSRTCALSRFPLYYALVYEYSLMLKYGIILPSELLRYLRYYLREVIEIFADYDEMRG